MNPFPWYNQTMTIKGNYTCIFGGGAVRGYAYVGAIKALKELQLNVKTFAGSSVGSIVASLLAVGCTADEIKDTLKEVNFELFKDIHFSINKDFALSKGNLFTEWIRDAIEKKYYGENYKKGKNEPVKFKDIDKNLVILTTDLNTFTPTEFSTFETPDFEIAQAVRISCSMPGLMTPVETEDKRLVDGDLLKGIPLWQLSKNITTPDSRILEFRLEGENVRKDGNTFDFLNSIYSCMTSASTDFIIDVFGENDKYDYVKITTGGIIVIDFNLSDEVKEHLIDIGYKDSMHYLTSPCVKKKMRNANCYERVVTYLEKLIREIKYRNCEKSKDVLKDLFLYMSDVYKYIDSDIFESLWTLKNDVLSAQTKLSFFKNKKFKDNTSLLSNAEILKKIITIKKEELISYVENIG